jgi:crotonobetainyl-CoA:carnitine CoA-transferase CaiB-like acyl-CoA transferase
MLRGTRLKLSGTPCDVKLNFPQTGEHTESVLLLAGYRDEEIKAFRESGII